MKERNIEVTQGDARILPFRIRDVQTNELIDQSGGYVFLTVKSEKNDSDDDAIISIKQSATSTQTDIFVSSENNDKPLGKYYYDIQFVDASGNPTTYFKGIYEITWQSTQRNA